jgi:hypothetical protein
MQVFQQSGLVLRSLGTVPSGTCTIIGRTNAFSVVISVYRTPRAAQAQLRNASLDAAVPRTRTIRDGAVVIAVQYLSKAGPLPVVPWRVARAVVTLRHGG